MDITKVKEAKLVKEMLRNLKSNIESLDVLEKYCKDRREEINEDIVRLNIAMAKYADGDEVISVEDIRNWW